MNAFDAAGWEHIITARELKDLVELVLDTLLPLDKEGIRVPVRRVSCMYQSVKRS